jgi:hypothetical protein
MKVWFLGLLVCLVACTGSSEPEKDFQLIFGIGNLPAPTGVLAGCSTPLSTAGGLLRIDSRKLETTNSTGNCSFVATPSAPFDLERSVRVSAAETPALFVSFPKASVVQAYNSQISAVLWSFPSATTPLPSGWTDFCPTQITLSSSNTPIVALPSEHFLLVLDDPKDQKDCGSTRETARLLVLNRDGTRKGWVSLDFAARVNGQIRMVASDTEIYLLYADNGASYRLARLAFSSLSDDTKTTSLQFSDAIPNFSNPSTNLALAFTNSGLTAGIGGTNGKVFPITFKDNKIELGAELRETTETSDQIGATQGIFWNRDSSTSNLSIFARERPDILLRRGLAIGASKINRSFNTQDGIFTSDSSFWGISNNAFYRLDVFNFPNIQTLQGLTNLGNAQITSLTWLISN